MRVGEEVNVLSLHTANFDGERIRFLSALSIFQGLHPGDVRLLSASATTRRLPRGQILFTEGEPLQEMLLLETGSAKMTRSSRQGKELIVGLIPPRECFGALTHPVPSLGVGQTLEDSVLHAIPVSAVRQAIRRNPSLSSALISIRERQWAEALVAVTQVAHDSVPRRLAQALLGLCGPEDGRLKFPIHQGELAQLIGSRRETVCLILNRLGREGVLSLAKGQLRVLNRPALSDVN